MVELPLPIWVLLRRATFFAALVDLDSICATFHGGCMGLPQILVDRIVDTLHDDRLALKACALTCKAMFASARHLVHQMALCLTSRNNQRVLTREERRKLRRLTQGYQDVQLRFLAYMDERGLLQHTRKIYIHSARQGDIHNTGTFTPDALRPHMHHFQSPDRVHVITIDLYDSDVWANHHKSCFAHFCPTLTSLTLRRPLGNHRHVLQFFLQFPNLENLCLEWLDGNVGRARPNLTTPAIVDQSSLPHRHFRLDHADNAVQCPMKLIYGLQHGFNLRSVELEDSFGDHGQRLLNACANTLQYLTITASSKGTHRLSSLLFCKGGLTKFPPTGYERLGSLKLGEIKDLRRVTVRPILATYFNFARSFPLIFTISSTALCELELVVGRFPPHFDGVRWDLWGGIDWFLYDRFAKHGNFKLTIKFGHCYDMRSFRRDVKEGFRWLASRGCIHFETYPIISDCWD